MPAVIPGETMPVDEPVDFRAAGFRPGEHVRLTVTMPMGDDRRWVSHATFAADSHGVVDPATAAPETGTYHGADATGLLWSMSPQHDGKPFSLRELTPLSVHVTAQAADSGYSRTKKVTRLVVPLSVTSRRFSEPGASGMFFFPSSAGPHPTVVVLGGSDGGLRAAHAALLAGHGFAALALAYFGGVAQPRQLVKVPVEFWRRARRWLASQPDCDLSRVAVLGSSKGAELALLLASTYPADFTAVVAYAPSAVVFEGIPVYRQDGSPVGRKALGPASSWTINGTPVPFVGFTASSAPSTGTGWMRNPAAMSLRSLHENALAGLAADDPAVIRVERIAGPVLLVSGMDDEVWPAARLAAMVVDRMVRHGRADDVTHLSYPAVGHRIGIPYLPTTGDGAAQPRAAANADSWGKALGFLRTHLRVPLS